MKVLFFSNSAINLESDGIQGTGNWASSLVNAINTYIDEIEIIYAFHDSKKTKVAVNKFNEKITIIQIPTNGKKSKIGKLTDNWLIKDVNKSSLNYYQQIIETFQPEIIQIFGLESPFIRVIGKTVIPVVVHIQGLLPPYMFKFYNRFTLFQLLRSTRLISLLKAQTPIQEKIISKLHIKLEKKIYSNCEYFLGRTDWDRLVSKVIAPQAKYYYCQEIMRDPFYQNQWEYMDHGEIRIFTTISPSFYKNVDMIFEVTKLLETYFTKFQFIWTVAGIDSSDIIPRLMQKKGFKSKHLKLLGRLGAGDLINEMLQSDLFILPSAIENSPNALQEAMLLGMPIIATYAGGVSSLIEHGQTGYLVPEGEPYSMAGAIIELKGFKEKLEIMGNNARKVAMSRNDPFRVICTLIDTYKVIISEKRS